MCLRDLRLPGGTSAIMRDLLCWQQSCDNRFVVLTTQADAAELKTLSTYLASHTQINYRGIQILGIKG